MAQCLEFFGSNLVAHTTVNLSCMKKCYEAKCTASTSSNSLRQSQYKAPAFHNYPWQSLTIFWRTTQPQQSLQFPGSTLELFVGVCRPVIRILTLFRSKKSHFPHPFSYLASKNSNLFLDLWHRCQNQRKQKPTKKLVKFCRMRSFAYLYFSLIHLEKKR